MTGEAEDPGRGPVEASRIEALAGFGLAAADIAHVLGTDEETLLARHAASIENGRIKANAKVAESLFRKATGEGRESVTAAIFWLKTRARWKESVSASSTDIRVSFLTHEDALEQLR
jgi:hypothetical protein